MSSRTSRHLPGCGLHEVAFGEALQDVVVPLGLQLDGVGARTAALRHVTIAGVNLVEDGHGLRCHLADGCLPGVLAELREVAQEDAQRGGPRVRPRGGEAHGPVLDWYPVDEVVIDGLVPGRLLRVAGDPELHQESRHRSVDGEVVVVLVRHELQEPLRALRRPRRHYPQGDVALAGVEGHFADVGVGQVLLQRGLGPPVDLAVGRHRDGEVGPLHVLDAPLPRRRLLLHAHLVPSTDAGWKGYLKQNAVGGRDFQNRPCLNAGRNVEGEHRGG
mmetsp:Transcript_13398/g.27892  ORF Transcript_13398/g.27892 Transcript_13398/m.27892 type:complete len:274 (-) Transcript_13398:26-847(-)